jgi:hypothetical protein
MDTWADEKKLYDCNIIIDAVVEARRILVVNRRAHFHGPNRNAPHNVGTFTELLWESKDPRMGDLAAALEDGQFVTTRLILTMVYTKLVKVKGIPAATAQAILKTIETTYPIAMIPRMDSWEYVKPYALGRTADTVTQYAPENLAVMDRSGRAVNPADGHGNVTADNMEKIDGEDLSVLLAVQASRAVLVTGDRNLAEGNSKLPGLSDARKNEPGRETVLYTNPNGGGWRRNQLMRGTSGDQRARTIHAPRPYATGGQTITAATR